MKYVVIVLVCLLAGVASSCFRPQLSCGRCETGSSPCPSGLTCRSFDNLCVYEAGEKCKSALTMPDGSAGTATATGGAGTGTGGGGGTAGMEPGVATGGGPGGTAGSRPVACTDHCCIGEQCLPFPTTLQDGLLFWADRTSMGNPGYVLSAWRDRSKYANDIVPVTPDPPRVQLYEGGAVVRIDQTGMVIASKDAPATALGGDDFTILVLARCEDVAPRSCVFRQAHGGGRPLMSVALYCNSAGDSILPPPYMNRHAELRVVDENVYPAGGAATLVSQRTDLPGGMHLFGARRVEGTRLQLRVDGMLEGEINIPETLALAYQTPIYVGSCAPTLTPYMTSFIGEVGAAVVVHGNLSDEEVASLERFLIDTRAAAP